MIFIGSQYPKNKFINSIDGITNLERCFYRYRFILCNIARVITKNMIFYHKQ